MHRIAGYEQRAYRNNNIHQNLAYHAIYSPLICYRRFLDFDNHSPLLQGNGLDLPCIH